MKAYSNELALLIILKTALNVNMRADCLGSIGCPLLLQGRKTVYFKTSVFDNVL
jgi:hypothetical protein